MKKIDLHIHTQPTISDDYDFSFDLDVLRDYVKGVQLDAIAITNHNLFDLEQFKKISDALDILVFPGIEINFEGTHLLLIGDGNEIDAFSQKSSKVSELIQSVHDSISVEQLRDIFGDLSAYLLIPHYDKDPKIKEEILKRIDGFITAGEVSSHKKFKYCIQDNKKLVPVLFSDFRTDLRKLFPVRQTFIDADDLSLQSIKLCLMDRQKVSLSPNGGHELFQLFSDGQLLSNGLNIILGARSSGKTVFLEKIKDIFSSEKVLYVEQFELVQKTNDEKDFNERLGKKEGELTEEHLKEFKQVVADVIDIDLDENNNQLNSYLNSLLQFAKEESEKDIYAKTSLYSENKFSIISLNGLGKLINSLELILGNQKYEDIIEKYVSKSNLRKLILELILKYRKESELNEKKQVANSVIKVIQEVLCSSSSSVGIEFVDIKFYQLHFDKLKLDKFAEICNLLKARKDVSKNQKYGKFTVVAYRRQFDNATDLKEHSGKNISFAEVFEEYSDPITYLNLLKSMADRLNKADLYRYFVKIDYKILNQHGTEASGGERTEFKFLERTQDAYKFDMVLLDEPESSFDNIFLIKEINKKIKELSKTVPVVMVTHNNTLGASIKPDYVFYTHKDIINGKVTYKVFSGNFYVNDLQTIGGETIPTRLVLLDFLEAGEESYKERNEIYKNYKQ